MASAVKLNFDTYYDKVKACWIGKNMGGTMGAPYEGKREILDIKGFITKPGEVVPNDDLDLQLVWLYALERTTMRKSEFSSASSISFPRSLVSSSSFWSRKIRLIFLTPVFS